ncbi:MAG TPA: hypothetical protein PK874_07955 [Desulfobacteraceae bacterium]|nr:hypothetical protein [Desulfobacteraceae bacterium]HPJ67114.1 hypothetical protein [Desulfobacteraceae bacterium]HPQ28359.1 hypothetical protein [Desulfobacteraceae bacterium]
MTSISSPVNRKKMVIISAYVDGESYGLLGPQMSATIIEENTQYECIVIAVTREDDKSVLKGAINEVLSNDDRVVGFSCLNGREDLFSFAKDLTEEGWFTILAGPQADVDFIGEKDHFNYEHRFKGLSTHFSLALHGPAEQAISLLNNINTEQMYETSGLIYRGKNGEIIKNPKKPWDEKFLNTIQWDNIYRLREGSLVKMEITTGQVLQQIGCPYASHELELEIDYPVFLDNGRGLKVNIYSRGCSFCDVAVDKGFHGVLKIDTVIDQIKKLPEMLDGRKIPFELINENPLPGLPALLDATIEQEIALSQINLILRADWLVSSEKYLRISLKKARQMRLVIILTSVGFESFNDLILKNLNKGTDLETNIKAIQLMRRLKKEFPFQFGYSKSDGAVHGFIHPTPWDSDEIMAGINKVISRYDLVYDILPPHSVPLIIHHASALGNVIREIEVREDVKYKRFDSVIGWWQMGDRFILDQGMKEGNYRH